MCRVSSELLLTCCSHSWPSSILYIYKIMPFTDLIHILAQLGLYNLEVIMYLFHPNGMAFEPLISNCKQHVHHYNYVQIFWVFILWKAERKLLAIYLTYHIHLLHDAVSKSQYNDVQETN